MRKERKDEKRKRKKNDIKKEEKKIMRKELGLKRREREVEGGNIKERKKRKKRIRACNVALCLLHCLLYKYQAVSTPPQLLQSWGQLCPGRGRCDENASLPLI